MKHCLSGLLAMAAAGTTQAQAPETLEFQSRVWNVDAEHAQLVEHLGARALHWRDGIVWLDERSLGTGEIRFDLALAGQPGHTGLVWHARGPRDWEKFYFRHHLSGRPDSVQYTPAFDGVTGWQIYSDSDAMSVVDHGLNRWMAIRVVIAEDSADIYMDGALIHHVPDLLRDEIDGGIGFWQLSPNDQASAYIRNVQIDAMSWPDSVGTPSVTPDWPEGLVSAWRVSAPFDEARLDTETLAEITGDVGDWTTLEVENNGIANLARAARISDGNTVLAEVTLTAETAQTVMMGFGYSDRVVVALNGERLFHGNNGWSTRDYRYLGTVTRHVGLPLDLQAGANTLTFAVSETFGGWAVTAELEDADGVEVSAR